MIAFTDAPSPNFDARRGPPDILVLHYTELPLQESLDILCDDAREHRVSSHYVLAEDGTAYRLVPENRTAWHAGLSHWRGREALMTRPSGITKSTASSTPALAGTSGKTCFKAT